MKAIVNANQNSLYKRLNGLTFEIVKIMHNGLFCLNINGTHTDFSASEILIVDFQNEIQSAYDAKNWDSGVNIAAVYNSLVKYQEVKNINFNTEYYCPS